MRGGREEVGGGGVLEVAEEGDGLEEEVPDDRIGRRNGTDSPDVVDGGGGRGDRGDRGVEVGGIRRVGQGTTASVWRVRVDNSGRRCERAWSGNNCSRDVTLRALSRVPYARIRCRRRRGAVIRRDSVSRNNVGWAGRGREVTVAEASTVKVDLGARRSVA